MQQEIKVAASDAEDAYGIKL